MYLSKKVDEILLKMLLNTWRLITYLSQISKNVDEILFKILLDGIGYISRLITYLSGISKIGGWNVIQKVFEWYLIRTVIQNLIQKVKFYSYFHI